MANVALIIAGGMGERMHQDMPKQFLSVNDKPIIVYTMECFQNHPDIDAIYVSCLKGWECILKAYAKQFDITKLEEVIEGGINGQASIRNGVYAIAEKYGVDDLILIHDAIRPMLSADVISDNIAKCNDLCRKLTELLETSEMTKEETNILKKLERLTEQDNTKRKKLTNR